MTMIHRKIPHGLPSIWLFTDERVSDGRLISAAERLPRGAGIIFRHYGRAESDRRQLYETLKHIVRRRRGKILLAGQSRKAILWGADGWHAKSGKRHAGPRSMIRSAPAHNLRDAIAAQRQGADIIFLSPLHATRSHPGQRALGGVRFGLTAQRCEVPVFALGGMNPMRGRAAKQLGAVGWGAIDALAV